MLFISIAVRQVKGLAHTFLQKWVLCLFTCSPNDPRDSYSRDSQDVWEEQHRWQAGFLRWCDSPSVFFSPLSFWRASKWQDSVLGLPPREWGGAGAAPRRWPREWPVQLTAQSAGSEVTSPVVIPLSGGDSPPAPGRRGGCIQG